MSDDRVSRGELLASLSGLVAVNATPSAHNVLLPKPPHWAPAIVSPGQLTEALRRMADSIEAMPLGDTAPYCNWADVSTMLIYLHDEVVTRAGRSNAWNWKAHHSACPKG